MTLPLPAWDPQDPSSLQFILDLIANAVTDTGGQSVGQRFGTATLTFAANATSNNLTVTHGLGRTPVVVIPGDNNGIAAYCHVVTDTFTTTTFRMFGKDTDNVARTGTQTVSWLAIG